MAINEDWISTKIYTIRKQRVMLDRDLAELYGVQTRALKQAVRRNSERFPRDFMFEMTAEELNTWRSQFVTSKDDRKGLRHRPFCFTEQGVTMLSSVLRSKVAVEVSISVVRVFVKMREVLRTNKDLLLEFERVRKKLSLHDEQIELIFRHLKQFAVEKPEPRKRIGYKP